MMDSRLVNIVYSDGYSGFKELLINELCLLVISYRCLLVKTWLRETKSKLKAKTCCKTEALRLYQALLERLHSFRLDHFRRLQISKLGGKKEQVYSQPSLRCYASSFLILISRLVLGPFLIRYIGVCPIMLTMICYQKVTYKSFIRLSWASLSICEHWIAIRNVHEVI